MSKPRNLSMFIRSLIVGLLVSLTACNLPVPASGTGEQTVQLIQPQEGAQFALDEEVSVVSTFSDPSGAKGMVLEVNGVAIRDDKFFSPMFQGKMDQPWQPAQTGSATLCVYLSTSSGQLLRSNCVTVRIGNATTGSVNIPTSASVETFTPIPELTAIPTLTLTPGAPTATATQDANCRVGPSTGYAVAGNLLTGQSAPIVGRNIDTSWWVINIGGSECWIWGELVTVTGDIGQVPVKTPPPLPTATFTRPAPLSAPTPISPSGTLSCATVTGGVTLSWAPVSYPNGISYYEWELIGGVNKTGQTSSTQAVISLINCGASYQWRVRAVDGLGNVGPWSVTLSFNVP